MHGQNQKGSFRSTLPLAKPPEPYGPLGITHWNRRKTGFALGPDKSTPYLENHETQRLGPGLLSKGRWA